VARPTELTLAFLETRPAEAARVLERMVAADAAGLFAVVPARAGVGVIAAMLPPAAARILGALDDETVLALLCAAPTQTVVAILRFIAEPHRTRLIEGLPTATAVATRLLLGYPDDSVGAWVDPDVLILPAGLRAGEAIDRVRRGREAQSDELFAVDAEGRLAGTVPLFALLRAPEPVSLATLMHKPLVLPAIMPLAGALTQRGWERASALPVIDRAGRPIGALRRAALSRALARARGPAGGTADDTLIGALARGYWDALSGIAESLVSLLPAAAPVRSQDE
jgi:magnesium transporter